MQEQLEAIVSEFEGGTRRLERLAQEMPAGRWFERPATGSWSVGECVAHLNLTTLAFRPLVQQALDQARRRPHAPAPRRYKAGLLGRLVLRALKPGGLLRVRTTAPFVPGSDSPMARTIDEFSRLQDEQVGWVRAADGLPLSDVRILSPFDGRVHYNLFASLSILARHQQRHLLQAERAWDEIRKRAAEAVKSVEEGSS